MVELAHHVPGRLRIRVSRLKGDAAVAGQLCRELLGTAGVTSVGANSTTGSVTIHYDRDVIDPEGIWDALRRLGYPAGEARPAASSATDKLVSAAADHLARAALDFLLARLMGRPAAAVIGALI